MSASLDCPLTKCCQGLLDANLPPDQRERYEHHLESCPACQDHLDRTHESEDLLGLVRQVGDPTTTPTDPALVQVLERLHELKSPVRTTAVEQADLYFLRLAEEPDILGMLGSYEVREVIGQGGMGVVLLAFEPALHRMVAIKVLAAAVAGSATARKRFTREAQAAAAVCHDHIVTVHGVHEEAGLPYLVMQYIAGESLQTRLDRLGPLEVLEIVRIGMQTASGLAAAHAQGLIHRDIKPANLLLENGLARVKITDFGLARSVDDVGLTQDGVVAGTPEYMAPEQARGEPVDHRADLFSLGSVLYALCTGVPPFRGSSTVAVLCQVNTQTPAPIRSLNPEIPAWLEALIERLMAKDPAGRFQSAAEVAQLLEGYLAHLRQPATVPAPKLQRFPEDSTLEPSTSPMPARRTRWLVAVFLVLVFGLGLVLWLAGGEGGGKTTAYLNDVYQDLRNLRELSPGFTLEGNPEERYTRREPGGLHVMLPANRDKAAPVAIQTSFRVSGDFEITGTYELLSASEPARDNQVAGPSLWIWGEGKQCARLGRFNTRKTGSVYEVHHTAPQPPTILRRETNQSSGQLRLVRQGTQLSYQISDPTTQGEFKELFKTEFGTDDLTMIRLAVNAPEGNCAVDARLFDLRIRSGRPGGDQVQTDLPLPQKGSKGWLAAAGIIGLLLAGTLLGVGWLSLRRRRAVQSPPSPVEDAQAKPETASPTVSFPCSHCGKILKTRAELAGKKVRCNQCGQGVLIPPPTTDPTAIAAPAPQRKKVRGSGLKMWWFLGSVLFLVPVLVFGGYYWMRQPAERPSFLNVSLSSQLVAEVEESGFYDQEYDEEQPFRWTNGNA